MYKTKLVTIIFDWTTGYVCISGDLNRFD